MVEQDSSGLQDRPAGRWDHLIGELHALRRRSGDPSFAEIARRISQRRTDRGASEHAARVARSSVHDAFRLGRTRVNLPLVREIVTALDADPSVVDDWINPPAAQAPEPAPTTVEPTPRAYVLLLMAACLALNLAGRAFVDFFHLPVYLDMVGTAIAALALGPWRGALVGASTNVVGVIGSGFISLPFALVNVVGALVWGYGVRRFGLGRTLPRFLGLNLLVAVSCSLVAVPILLAVGGSVQQGQDMITENFRTFTDTLAVAVSASNLLTSCADKLISGFAALVAVSALPLSLRVGTRLVLVDPTVAPPDQTT